MKKLFRGLGKFLIYYCAIHIVASFVAFYCLMMIDGNPSLDFVTIPAVVVTVALLNLILKHWIDKTVVRQSIVMLIIAGVVFTVLMLISNGAVNGNTVVMSLFVLFPYVIYGIIAIMMTKGSDFFIAVFAGLFTAVVVQALLAKDYHVNKKVVIGFVSVALVLSATNIYLGANRDELKYKGHNFDYMNGYSSTDFTDYMVYAENSKLVSLGHKADLQIETNMPKMDGAEACYPLYAAIAKEIYVDIDRIEFEAKDTDEKYHNGKIVTFTNSVIGFRRLLEGEVDLFFGARPSANQLIEAEKYNKEIEVIPIGKEGFVFFVEKDNPIDNISSEDLKAIYHGDITNWKQLGGKNEEIEAFQRPANSGSQTMMEYFMGDVSLKEPKSYELIGAMGEVIKVAEYANEKGAIGYTFRYFLEGLNQEKGVKMLSIDGVYPSRENIADGSYPLTTNLCLVVVKNNTNPNVQKVIDFILSNDGQYLVEQTGYGRLAKEQRSKGF